MKTLFFKFLFLAFFAFFSSQVFADTVTVSVGAGGSMFTPDNITLAVGSYVKWVYVDGFHTTTCDPNLDPADTLPAGASTWDANMQTSGDVFVYHVMVAGHYHYTCQIHSPFMSGNIDASGPSGITPASGEVNEFRLQQNYPNPFNPSTTIKFSIPETGFISLKVYDIYGRESAVLVNGEIKQGSYEFNFNAQNLASGVYYYTLKTPGFTQTKRMMLIK